MSNYLQHVHEVTGREAMEAAYDPRVGEATSAGLFAVVAHSPVFSDCDAIFGYRDSLVATTKTYKEAEAIREEHVAQFDEETFDPWDGPSYHIRTPKLLTWDEAKAQAKEQHRTVIPHEGKFFVR